MKKLPFPLLLGWLLMFALPPARAQQPGGLDPSFAPAKVDLGVQQIIAQAGGKVVVAGRYTTINGTAVGPVVRLKADGTLDPDFANTNLDYIPAGDTQVNSIAIASGSDGKIYVALNTTPSFTATLVRLNANGSTDANFHATIDGAPNAMVVQPNGQVVIAGSFSILNGVTVSGCLARLEPDGSTDSSFDTSPRPGAQAIEFTFAYELAVQADGKFLVGGIPSYTNTSSVIARLNTDGSLDNSFFINSVDSGSLDAFVLQPDGNLVIGYNVTTLSGTTAPYTVRLLTHSTDGTDGQVDPAFQPGNAVTAFPYNIVAQADGKLVYSFGTSIFRLNADGSADRTFTLGAPSNSTDAIVYAQSTDGNLLAAGQVLINDNYVPGIARLLGSVPGGATTVSVVVPGNANIWLARDGSTDLADVVPLQQPVRVVDLTLSAGAVLSFNNVTGAVDFGGNQPTDGPDGRTTSPENHAAENGISGVNAPLDGLVGVFIDDTAAGSVTSTPASLDFSGAIGLDFATLQPALGQVFFIGNGQTSGVVTQQFTVPAGATHLVLGTVDGLGWYNNTGEFAVTISASTGGGGTGGGGGALTVPGTANVWLAGQENGIFASKGADQAPAQSPVQVPGLTLDPNKGLVFSVGGTVNTGGGSTTQYSPDGNFFVTHAAENGITGTKTHQGALIGVFLSDNTPSATSVPGDLDYSIGAGVSASSYSPRLQQAFFIGDGEDTLTRTQTFYPPAGATRLFLGVMDNTAFSDNTGSFNVGVTTSTVDPSDLRVSESVTSSSTPGGNGSFALVSDVLTYTFTVRNSGKATFTNAVLHDVLPSYIDLSKTVISDGGSVDSSVVAWSLGTLAPGATATRTLQVTLANNAPLGVHLTNPNYSATADGLPDVAGRDRPDTLIESAVSVKITNNTATGKPGGIVKFVYDLSNTTPEAFKKLTLTVPFLPGLSYHDVYFVDSNGNRLPVDTKGKKVAAYNQQSNSAVFTLNSLAGGGETFLVVEATVAYNFNPVGLVSLPGAQIVISKYTNGQPITLALDDSSSALSGQPADAPPKLVFGKSVVTGNVAAILLAANPNTAALLNAVALKPFLDLNPNQKTVAKLGNFTTLAALTADQITQVFNPFVGSDTDPDTNAAVSTVPEPATSTPNPFVTFGLAFSNTGSGKATSVTVFDSAPKGLVIDRDSFFVNGVATPQSAIQFNDDGSYAITTKNLKPGKGGLIFYRAKVLAPADPPNGVDVGGYIEPTSAQLTIENLDDEVIAPAPDKLLLTGPAHASVSSTQTGDTTIGSNVTYTILYKNDGGQTITDFRVVSPVPPGGAFQSAQFLGIDQQTRVPNGAKGESLASPGMGATSGLTVFHLGKVKTRGLGLVQVVYQMTSAVLQQPGQALVHQPYVAATGGLPTTNGLSDRAPLHRQLRQIVTRDTGDTSVGAAASPNTSRPSNNPNGPHLGMTVACSQTVNTGETLGFTFTVVSLGHTGVFTQVPLLPNDASITFNVPVPDGTEYAGIVGSEPDIYPVSAQVKTGANGKQYVTGLFPPLFDDNETFVTVSFRAQGASRSTINIPDMYLKDALSGTELHSGPVVATVTTPTDFANDQRLVALNTLNAVSTTTFTGAGFQQRVDQISSKSRFTAVINADYLSLENGVLIIPTADGKIVAQGGGNIVAQGGGNIVAQGGGNIVAQGGGNLISVKNIVDGSGKIISQDGSTIADLFAGIVAQGGGNIVAQGGGNIVAQGGGNLQSVGVKVISNDGGSFAASADKALAISQADLASFGQATSLSGDVFRSESGNTTLMTSGFAAAVAGGAIKVDGLVKGTNDNLSLSNVTSQGNVIRAGSGIVAQGGGN